MANITDLETDLPDCPMYSREEWGRCTVPGWGKNGDFLGNVPTFWRSI